MEESDKKNLFITFSGVINAIIEDKRKNPKNVKLLNSFEGVVNLGLQVEEDYYFWLNLIAKDGNYKIDRGRLENFDLELMADPGDLLYFSNGTNSTVHMVIKKNRFGKRKLRIKKGGRNLGKLLKISKILVLDKIPADK
ncbi:MAG: hypothetical protein KAX33_08545 [Candidatus Lokiarchaeota archaeon]|nr:hypothetical protein [Candidatus Lokiarchaeota archaeon]